MAALASPGALSSAQRDLPAEYFRGPRFSPDAVNCIQQAALLGASTYSGAFSRVGPSRGFSSFRALKREIGNAGPGRQWHHIVEQSKIGQFAAEQIHNRANVVSVPKSVNRRLNGFYSSKQPFSGTSKVREWLKGQSYEAQYKFGLYHTERILKEECRGH